MSGNRDEGQLFGGVRPSPLPCGRGFLVERRTGSRLVQVALLGNTGLPDTDGPADVTDGQIPNGQIPNGQALTGRASYGRHSRSFSDGGTNG